jgi:hypothetical protein
VQSTKLPSPEWHFVRAVTVLAIGEEEALPIQERATRKAKPSLRVALSQMLLLYSKAPQSLDLAL